jgi:hypothetical protein
MKKLTTSLMMMAAPTLIALLNVVLVSNLCLVLFLIFPPLVLLCIIPGTGLLPVNLTAIL